MDRTIEYIMPEEYAGRKIYEFLRDKGYSRQNLTDLKFTESGLYLGDNRIKLDYRIIPGDVISVCIREKKSSENILPVNIPIEVVYEDEDILVVNKPADMPIHPSLNNHDNTLGNAVAYYYQSRGCDFVYRCINRLDRDTTGLVLIAKNMISAQFLSKQHLQGVIQKEYTAIVSGYIEEKEGTIDKPIGRVNDSTIKRRIDYENGERAVTHYSMITQNHDMSVVKLHLETGRTHQIRVHMASIGHPLIGDFLYNPDDTRMKRQALHVNQLSFIQPVTQRSMVLTAPIPKDMSDIIAII